MDRDHMVNDSYDEDEGTQCEVEEAPETAREEIKWPKHKLTKPMQKVESRLEAALLQLTTDRSCMFRN